MTLDNMMLALALAVAAGVGCGGGDDDDVPPEPVLPADYETTFQEVRNCRFSADHDLARIRVRAAPDALTPYTDRTTPFPVGALVVKEQFDPGDMECAGPVVRYTIMTKLAAGSAPEALDWEWNALDQDGVPVAGEDINRCIGCHVACGKPPDGYDGTCTVP